MTLLVDTHAFLWWLAGGAQLSFNARGAFADPALRKLLSLASAWEVAIKVAKGKLVLPVELSEMLDVAVASGFGLLPISTAHIQAVARLAQIPSHQDPFDRMLIAQALVEGVPILTSDRRFAEYGVEVVW